MQVTHAVGTDAPPYRVKLSLYQKAVELHMNLCSTNLQTHAHGYKDCDFMVWLQELWVNALG